MNLWEMASEKQKGDGWGERKFIQDDRIKQSILEYIL